MPVQQWSVQPQLPPQEKLASSRDFQTPLFDQVKLPLWQQFLCVFMMVEQKFTR